MNSARTQPELDAHETERLGACPESLRRRRQSEKQRDISAALTLMGERLCRLPFPAHVDFRPEGWIEPLHPDAWYE